MKTIYIIIVGFLLLATTPVLSQTNTIQDFNIESSEMSIQNNTISIISTITKNGNILTWTQNQNGNIQTTNFTIVNISGDWNSSNSTGNISIDIQSSGFSDTITLTSSNDDISLIMQSTDTTNNPEVLSFNVNTITYL